MAAVNEAKLKAIFKRDGLEKVELDLAKGRYFDRSETFMQTLVGQEKRRIDDDRYRQNNKTPWHDSLAGRIIIGLIIAVCGGLGVAYVAYFLGWL